MAYHEVVSKIYIFFQGWILNSMQIFLSPNVGSKNTVQEKTKHLGKDLDLLKWQTGH